MMARMPNVDGITDVMYLGGLIGVFACDHSFCLFIFLWMLIFIIFLFICLFYFFVVVTVFSHTAMYTLRG